MRQAIGFHKHERLPVLDGNPYPASTGFNADEIDKRRKTNGHLYSILFLASPSERTRGLPRRVPLVTKNKIEYR